MFDNLKEKLGSFRKDAEEAAEENAEAVDGDAVEDDAAVDDAAAAEDDAAVDAVDAEDGDLVGDAAAEDVESAAEPADSAEPADTPSEGSLEAELEREGATTARREDGADPDRSDGAGAPSTAGQPPEPDADAVADTDPAAPDAGTEPEAEPDAAVDPEADAEDAEDDEGGTSTGFGRKARSLVRGKFVIEADDLEGPLQDLELALLSSDVEMSVAEEIIETVEAELVGETRTFTTSTGEVVEEALREAILEVVGVGQFDFDERVATADTPLVIVFTGVNGVGKTTSIAKVDRYLEQRGYSTVMANGDTYRAGANEQIREHADARNTKLIAHERGGDPAAVLYDAVEYAEANDVDVVLGDTAGRLHTNEDLMAQLEKIDRVVDPDMTLFVDEAVAGQDAVNRARQFDDAAEIDGTVLTKADADSDGGAAISVAHVTGKPILFLGVGQGYDDLERFDPERMADRLVAPEE